MDIRKAFLVFGLVVGQALPAVAQVADPSASPAAYSDPSATGAATIGDSVAAYVWSYLNSWLISIIDALMVLWPSTPTALKLSTLVATITGLIPGAPWWIVTTFVENAVWVFGAVAILKTWKLIWP